MTRCGRWGIRLWTGIHANEQAEYAKKRESRKYKESLMCITRGFRCKRGGLPSRCLNLGCMMTGSDGMEENYGELNDLIRIYFFLLQEIQNILSFNFGRFFWSI